MRIKRSDALALTLLALGAAWTHSRVVVRNGPDLCCPACLFPSSSGRDAVGCNPVAPTRSVLETGPDFRYPATPGTEASNPETCADEKGMHVAKNRGPRQAP
jgi:hypothetical protein